MTPKAQQLGIYDMPTNNNNKNSENQIYDKKENNQRRPSSVASINSNDGRPSTSSILYSLSSRLTSVINPSILLLVATPIALRYPFIQLVMLFTILVGTSPLYFIMITFIGKSNKHSNCHKHQQPHHLHHRRQPSIVGSITEISTEKPQSLSR